MKQISFMLWVLCLPFLFTINAKGVYSTKEQYVFQVHEVSSERKSEILKSVNLSISHTVPEITYITGFDINDEGILAIASQVSSNYKSVHLYDYSQKFLRSYIFFCQGSFKVKWESDSLCIYLIRGDLKLSISLDNERVDVFEFPWGIAENQEYYRQVLLSEMRTYKNETYWLDNKLGPFDIGMGSYSRLLKLAEDGSETVLFDVSEAKLKRIISEFGVAALLVIFVVVNLIFVILRLRKQHSIKSPFQYLNPQSQWNDKQ